MIYRVIVKPFGESMATGPSQAKVKRSQGRASRSGPAVLFTCIGRRVSLLAAFRTAARRLRRPVRFYGTDTTPLSPALQRCDEGFLVEPISHPRYLDQLLSLVRRQGIRLVVPTIDLDLRLLAENRSRFEKIGCRVLISDPDVICICLDKRKTYRFFKAHGFATPVTCSVRQALDRGRRRRWTWPCYLKPWDGHAGKGTTVVHNRRELLFYAKRVPKAICQELIEGDEYTCDVYVDFEKHVRCVVPRRRLEVRSGEVSKAQIVKHPRLMTEVARLVERLGAGPGVVTVQAFLSRPDRITFIEVNPRFGGGVPLSIRAGADFPRWILQELAGCRPRFAFDAFQDGLTMLRYDAEIWFDEACAKGVRV